MFDALFFFIWLLILLGTLIGPIILITLWRELGFLTSAITLILIYIGLHAVWCHHTTCIDGPYTDEFHEILPLYLYFSLMYCTIILGIRYFIMLTTAILKWLFKNWRW